MEEDYQNIKTVESSVYYSAYTLLKSGNMWYNTNILKIHPNGMTRLKKDINHYLINNFLSIFNSKNFAISKMKNIFLKNLLQTEHVFGHHQWHVHSGERRDSIPTKWLWDRWLCKEGCEQCTGKLFSTFFGSNDLKVKESSNFF